MRIFLIAILAACWGVGRAESPDVAASESSSSTNVVEAAETTAPTNRAGFARYQSIVDRMPFGREPEGFDPEAPPGTVPAGAGRGGGAGGVMDEQMRSAEEQKLMAAVRVSAINVTPSGKVAVGFTDSSVQPAVNYYLKVGESRDGWLVKHADAAGDALKATLEKDGIEVELALGEGSSGGNDKKKGLGGRRLPGAASNAPARRVLGAAAHRPATLEAPPPGSAMARLKARRAERETQERQQREAAAEAQAKKEADAAAEQARKEAEAAAAAEERKAQREALEKIQEELRAAREREDRVRREKEEAEDAAASSDDAASESE